jgi:class 3 adenylate cyclase
MASFLGPIRLTVPDIRGSFPRLPRTPITELGIDVRAGLQTGECELVDGKMSGIALHIGARVAAEAGANEVLVSSTVRDLVVGSGSASREVRIHRVVDTPASTG